MLGKTFRSLLLNKTQRWPDGTFSPEYFWHLGRKSLMRICFHRISDLWLIALERISNKSLEVGEIGRKLNQDEGCSTVLVLNQWWLLSSHAFVVPQRTRYFTAVSSEREWQIGTPANRQRTVSRKRQVNEQKSPQCHLLSNHNGCIWVGLPKILTANGVQILSTLTAKAFGSRFSQLRLRALSRQSASCRCWGIDSQLVKNDGKKRVAGARRGLPQARHTHLRKVYGFDGGQTDQGRKRLSWGRDTSWFARKWVIDNRMLTIKRAGWHDWPSSWFGWSTSQDDTTALGGSGVIKGKILASGCEQFVWGKEIWSLWSGLESSRVCGEEPAKGGL